MEVKAFMMTSQNTIDTDIIKTQESEIPPTDIANYSNANNHIHEPKWFAMKAVRKESIAMDKFMKHGIKTYCPMIKTDINNHGKKIIIERPLITNTFFVYGSYPVINRIKNENVFITYCYRKEGKGYKILEIPTREMELFISSSEKMNEDITYYRPGEVELSKGDRVRIIGGIFDGYEGTLLKSKGRAKRMFLINFELLGSLGTHIEPEYIQLLK